MKDKKYDKISLQSLFFVIFRCYPFVVGTLHETFVRKR